MDKEIKERIAAINSGIIPEGYKKTKVGIVPVEWDIKALGKISQFLDNQRKPVKENERSSGIYPYYGASGIIDYVDDYLFDGEYILLGEDGANIVMRSSPLAFKVKGKMWINNHAHVISPNDNCNIDFLVNILESLNYEKYNSGTAQPKLNREVCESITLPFPPLPEQQKIAEILSTQDKLIELQEKKTEQLKELKKAYLQKMFPKKGSKYPELRFKGFTDPWEQRELGDLMEITSVKRIHQSDWTNSGVRFLRARDIVAVSKNEEVSEPLFISQEKYDEYSALSGKVKIGDLLVTGVGTIGVPMLINSEEPLYFKDGNIIWFKNENTIDGRFFYHSFNGSLIQSFIKESSGTGTVGTYTIESGKKTPIFLPAQKEEQEKIGAFFSNLDNAITLHQRKSEQEKQKKKALMQLLLTGIVRTKLIK